MPYGHRVIHNVTSGGAWLDLSEGMNFSQVRVENNVVGDSMVADYLGQCFKLACVPRLALVDALVRTVTGCSPEPSKIQ